MLILSRFAGAVIRMDTPATMALRICKEETEMAGTIIPRGAVVMARIDAANRDPAMFEDPDTFNPLRTNLSRHLSFGAGIHHCIGFRLAKEQTHQSLVALLTRLHDIRLDRARSDLSPSPSIQTRSLRGLHITFRPGERLSTAAP